VEEAVEEAQFVMENIRPYNVTWPIVLDIEDAASATARTADLTQQQRTDHAIAFCETIKENGYTPMLYCNIRWFIEKLDISRITEYDKWFAQYFHKPFFPYAFQIWQYSSTGEIEGIKGNVDYDISFIDYGNRTEEAGE
jgi:GH25 family lysozyme M1 (1,4-beta-N-acetylmuramidase)